MKGANLSSAVDPFTAPVPRRLSESQAAGTDAREQLLAPEALEAADSTRREYPLGLLLTGIFFFPFKQDSGLTLT